MKPKYYKLNNMLKIVAQYKILLGERSNGKSYAVKKNCLANAYKNGELFGYLRRYKFDVKSIDVENYFSDMPIEIITNGEYDTISVYRGVIYFAKFDTENNKILRGKKCGYIYYLSGLEHFKSQAFPDVTDIIFEEFITNKMYLDNEPSVLQHFISTIARLRTITVWMIGNTINRVCPYFQEWELKNIPYQKQGTIEIYNFHTTQFDEKNKEIIVTIAVEFCENSGNTSNMFFGSVGKSITSGCWECSEKPKLPYDKNIYEIKYELVLSDFGFSFVVQLLRNPDNNGLIVYVYPYTYKRNIKRKITSVFSDDPLTSFYLSDKIKGEIVIANLIKEKKVCYSDNLTGSDFEQVLLNRKGGV